MVEDPGRAVKDRPDSVSGKLRVNAHLHAAFVGLSLDEVVYRFPDTSEWLPGTARVDARFQGELGCFEEVAALGVQRCGGHGEGTRCVAVVSREVDCDVDVHGVFWF